MQLAHSKSVTTKFGEIINFDYNCDRNGQAVLKCQGDDEIISLTTKQLQKVFLHLNMFSFNRKMKTGKALTEAVKSISEGTVYQRCYWKAQRVYISINTGLAIDMPTKTVENILEDMVGQEDVGYKCWSYEIK